MHLLIKLFWKRIKIVIRISEIARPSNWEFFSFNNSEGFPHFLDQNLLKFLWSSSQFHLMAVNNYWFLGNKEPMEEEKNEPDDLQM